MPTPQGPTSPQGSSGLQGPPDPNAPKPTQLPAKQGGSGSLSDENAAKLRSVLGAYCTDSGQADRLTAQVREIYEGKKPESDSVNPPTYSGSPNPTSPLVSHGDPTPTHEQPIGSAPKPVNPPPTTPSRKPLTGD